MKKIWVLMSALALAFALAACSNKTESEGSKEEKTVSKDDVKRSLVQYLSSITKAINDNDVDLNAFEASEEKPTEEIKTAASNSAAAVVDALGSVKVPEELKDQKSDLQAATKDVIASYQAKADELKKPAPSLDAANATLAQAEEKFGTIFKEAELLKPSISTSVQ
ncbi:hypothetical protein [Peribacillus sp. SCS-155]|uniref:hypothetical protein n=1 Tax=Peribacillus sedimenti TaxID=3115297 RepID=UPI003905AF9D